MTTSVRQGDLPERAKDRKFFRKQLIMPAEHGSWSWLLVPFFVGVFVAGEWNLPATLVLIGGLAGFLVRQPATIWLRTLTGRGRKADRPTAAAWTIILAVIAGLCLAALLALGMTALFALLVPLAILLVFYLVAARYRRAKMRSLWMELVGAAGLAATAPAAYTASIGQLSSVAWALWGLMAGQNALGVLYVRTRIADTHGRPIDRPPLLWMHVIVLLAVVVAACFGTVPWLAALPFVGFLIRAGWTVARVRPVANIKRFGFTEIGVEILGGALVILGYQFI
jgi:hypothetical protein